jgi:hypothetical protein
MSSSYSALGDTASWNPGAEIRATALCVTAIAPKQEEGGCMKNAMASLLLTLLAEALMCSQ